MSGVLPPLCLALADHLSRTRQGFERSSTLAATGHHPGTFVILSSVQVLRPVISLTDAAGEHSPECDIVSSFLFLRELDYRLKKASTLGTSRRTCSRCTVQFIDDAVQSTTVNSRLSVFGLV